MPDGQDLTRHMQLKTEYESLTPMKQRSTRGFTYFLTARIESLEKERMAERNGTRAVRVGSYPAIRPNRICYYKNEETGIWLIYHPEVGLGDLSEHTIIEEDDGSITVHPSIKISRSDKVIHGYLHQGLWQDA